MQILFLIFLFVVGACIGSFLCCTVRRIHLRNDKRISSNKRSVCLSCHYQLKWYDNLPIISWLLLRGKCRKCHQKIGIAEFLSEIAVAAAFLAIGTTINVETADVISWLIFIAVISLVIVLSFLAIFDGLYGELPVACLIVSIVFGFIILGLREYTMIMSPHQISELILPPFLSVLLLGGLYLLLYLISKGKWVGDGDWLLGTSIGLAIFSPWLAVFILCISNTLAFLFMLPRFIKHRHQKIYFGPFLVIAFVIVYCLSDQLLSFII
ncbi:prepilin peptidase [Candidatus Saccharibacteria bacterium]|nr:prepilin peptidase [Candidatus Saccharibacteria bacterium]